ncbi:MAG: diacylglycerol kinase family protein [bacterium]
MINFNKLKQSFKYAYRGVVYVFKNEQNFRLQILTGCIVVFLMIFFRVNRKEAILLVMIIMNVLVLEMINTVVEKLVDMLKPRIHFYAEIIKNIMSAAVLSVSIGSVIVGIIVFWPYLISLKH